MRHVYRKFEKRTIPGAAISFQPSLRLSLLRRFSLWWNLSHLALGISSQMSFNKLLGSPGEREPIAGAQLSFSFPQVLLQIDIFQFPSEQPPESK